MRSRSIWLYLAMVSPALYIATRGSLSCLQYASTVTYVEHKKNPIHTVTKYFCNFNFMSYKYFRLTRFQYSQECSMVPILGLFYIAAYRELNILHISSDWNSIYAFEHRKQNVIFEWERWRTYSENRCSVSANWPFKRSRFIYTI
jgi:hypothetical protein